MKSLKLLERRVACCFAGAVAASAVLGAWTLREFQLAERREGWVADSERVLRGLAALEGALRRAEGGMRSYVLTGRDRERASYGAAAPRFEAEARALEASVADDPAQAARARELARLGRERLANLEGLRRTFESDGREAARARVMDDRGNRLMDAAGAVNRAMTAEERRLLAARRARAASAAWRAAAMLGAVVLVHLVTLVAAFRMVAGEVARRRTLVADLRASEQRFRGAFEAAAAGMALVERDGRFTEVNASLAAMLGYAPGDLAGRTFQEITHPDDLPDDLDLLRRLDAGEVPFYRLEKRYRHRDGREVPILLSASAVRDEEGRPLHYVAHVEDLSEVKRAVEDRDRFFRLSLDMFCILGLDGAFQGVNPAFERSLGYPVGELIGRDVLEGIHPEDRGAARDEMARLHRGEAVLGFECRYRAASGGYRLLAWNAAAVPDRGQVYAMARDITEARRVEQVLAQQARELARSNAELEQFAYVASHDLQEPLRMIGSFTALLAKRYAGRLDARADQYIEFAVDGSRRMQQMIQDLLEYARVGTRARPAEPTDAGRVLERVAADLGPLIAAADAEVAADALPTVRIDPAQLARLLMNLVGNAIKFRSERPPRVHVSAKRIGRAWRFTVRDNGVGIDPQFAGRIFVLFQRLHHRSEYPGTGIGLAVCKKIVERQGGRIWHEPAPGGGSCFHFTLPDGDER
jgi:PAS domain S-box-containing protein